MFKKLVGMLFGFDKTIEKLQKLCSALERKANAEVLPAFFTVTEPPTATEKCDFNNAVALLHTNKWLRFYLFTLENVCLMATRDSKLSDAQGVFLQMRGALQLISKMRGDAEFIVRGKEIANRRATSGDIDEVLRQIETMTNGNKN